MLNEIKILVVEDEPIIADDLAFMLEEMNYQQIETVHSGEQALELVKKNHYDLVLLDINLEGSIDGVHVAEYLHSEGKTPFIFLTSLSDKSTIERVKKTYPSAYLVKPIDEKDLHVNVELALSKYQDSLNGSDYPAVYYIKHKTKMSKVITADILYLEGSNNYTIIHTAGKKIVVSQTLKKVQESMDPKNFLRIHKSAMVNLDKIEEIEDSHVRIGNIRIAIGRTFREGLMSRLDTI